MLSKSRDVTPDFQSLVHKWQLKEQHKSSTEIRNSETQSEPSQLRKRKGNLYLVSPTDAPIEPPEVRERRELKFMAKQLTSNSREILKNIQTLKNLLYENRKRYLDVNRHFAESGASSSADKDEIDQKAAKFIANCMESIQITEQEIAKLEQSKLTPQVRRFVDYSDFIKHWQAVIWYLRLQLAMASRIQKEQQELRFKYLVENSLSLSFNMPKSAAKSSSNVAGNAHQDRWSRLAMKQQQQQNLSALVPKAQFSYHADEELEKLTNKERQQLLMENQNLVDELAGMEDELDQVERNLLGISDLQGQLEMHLNTQGQEIDRIYDEAQGTTNTVIRGNAILHKISKGGSAYRMFMAVFFIVMSLALLFLHWYND